MMQTNWYVITGGPSSGKTSLVNRLAEVGYTTAPEVARPYIEELLAKSHTLHEIYQHNEQLQRDILAISLKRQRRFVPEDLIFFDRGTPDSLGYFRYYQLNAEQMLHGCKRMRYKKIFFCEQLPMIQDEVRIENNQTAKQISLLIREAYLHLDYDLIDLPNVSLDERLNILLTHIN